MRALPWETEMTSLGLISMLAAGFLPSRISRLSSLAMPAGLSMRTVDWFVLVTSLVSIVAYGLYRSRGSDTVDRYLLAGRSMPWYAMALSIMATQASAITFISTTGQ